MCREGFRENFGLAAGKGIYEGRVKVMYQEPPERFRMPVNARHTSWLTYLAPLQHIVRSRIGFDCLHYLP